jgi:hypothetical protein
VQHLFNFPFQLQKNLVSHVLIKWYHSSLVCFPRCMETSAVSVYDQGIIMWEIGHLGCVWPTKANRWVDHGAQQFFFYGDLQPHSLFTFQGMHNITVISLGEFNFLGKLNVICHLPSFGFQRELALWSWCASKYMLDHWCSLLTSVEFLMNKVLKHMWLRWMCFWGSQASDLMAIMTLLPSFMDVALPSPQLFFCNSHSHVTVNLKSAYTNF